MIVVHQRDKFLGTGSESAVGFVVPHVLVRDSDASLDGQVDDPVIRLMVDADAGLLVQHCFSKSHGRMQYCPLDSHDRAEFDSPFGKLEIPVFLVLVRVGDAPGNLPIDRMALGECHAKAVRVLPGVFSNSPPVLCLEFRGRIAGYHGAHVQVQYGIAGFLAHAYLFLIGGEGIVASSFSKCGSHQSNMHSSFSFSYNITNISLINLKEISLIEK